MAKPTVYIETTIAGHLASRLPRDVVVAAQMVETRRWWSDDRANFECFTSRLVLEEISRGDAHAATERLKVLDDIPLLAMEPQVFDVADLLLSQAALPAKAKADALHVAIAATSAMTYLLTWNCRHLANATLRARIEQACRDGGFEPPVICTPAELREVQR